MFINNEFSKCIQPFGLEPTLEEVRIRQFQIIWAMTDVI